LRLPVGATIAPVILSSDKARLSQFRGDKSAWPVYLMIGNIAKDVRRKPSSHATVLIGYIPVGKFDCFSDKTHPLAHYRTFHYAMSILLESMAEAGKNGVLTACTDGQGRHVFPILATYVADYPKQCLVACCMENRCPVCKVEPKKRGDHEENLKRTENETVSMLKEFIQGDTNKEFKESFTAAGIRPVSPPFWHSLPHTDIFQSFTPDLLHQLHKGVFKDHLVKWCTEILGEDEVDQ